MKEGSFWRLGRRLLAVQSTAETAATDASPERGQPTWAAALWREPLARAGVVVISIAVAAAVLAPWLTPYAEQGLGTPSILQKLQPPSLAHPLGTDYLGRDVLARLLFGARVSLGLGVSVAVVAAAIGAPLGAVAGYFGGWVDGLLMRITDVFLAFPPLLLAIAVAAALGPSLGNAIAAIALTWWPWYARIVRAQALSLRQQGFVEAARCMGVGHLRIIVRHVLPNAMTPVLVQVSMDVGAAILTGAAISFIGLGVQPPTADWGRMVSVGRIYFLQRPWFAGSAGTAIFLVTLACNLVGDAARDAADPKTRRACA